LLLPTSSCAVLSVLELQPVDEQVVSCRCAVIR
jgi:hypothetical protein